MQDIQADHEDFTEGQEPVTDAKLSLTLYGASRVLLCDTAHGCSLQTSHG